jgi:transmembrane sensor
MDASDRQKRMAQEAAEWWVLLQGEPTRGEREQYVDWLRESSLHVVEMLRVAQVHGALEQFKRWSGIPTDGSGGDEAEIIRLATAEQSPASMLGTPKPSPSRPRLKLAQTLAALLLVVIGAGAALYFMWGGQVIETQRGERREVALTDGSVVQVDPETRLRVQYEGDRRLVFLERGRALFHVAKNAARPFMVETDGTTVRAVGTSFAVERQNEAVVVTVAEGQVAVLPYSTPETVPISSPDVSAKSPSAMASKAGSADVRKPSEHQPTDRSARAPIFLMAGQQVTVDRAGSAEPVREVDSHRMLAWADGRLIFENDSVAHVVDQFNRYNRIQLTVHDAELARRTISGTFSAADPESFVAFLETVTSVRVQRNADSDITIEATK